MDALLSVEPSQSAVLTAAAVEHNRTTKRVLVGVEVTADEAVIAAVQLSQRYISGRQLPDKAIDLVDEAASKIRMEMDSKPEALDKLDRHLIQLKMILGHIYLREIKNYLILQENYP